MNISPNETFFKGFGSLRAEVRVLTVCRVKRKTNGNLMG